MKTTLKIQLIICLSTIMIVKVAAQDFQSSIYDTVLNLNKIYQPIETSVLDENDDIRIYSSANHQTENSIAIDPTNPDNILVCTNGRLIYNGDEFVTVHQPYFYSTDGGFNWNGSEDNPNGIYTGGDPVALFDYYGNAYYVTLGNPGGIFVLKSTTHGATWSNTVNADPLNSTRNDKEHAAADISGTYPDNIYVAWTDFYTDYWDMVLSRSTNSGSNFENRKTLYSGTDFGQGVNIAIGPNGEVYAAFANYTNKQLPESGIRFTKSTDGGNNFSTANVAFSISGIRTAFNGIAAFNNTRVNSYPSMEVDRSNGTRRGWIYIVYADRNTGDADIYLRQSSDGGSTWRSATRVNSDPVGNGKQQWFPSIDVDKSTGVIYVSYYSMDSDEGLLTSRYLAHSDDGGNTFISKRISDVQFLPTELGSPYRAGYMGDYYEIAAQNNRVYATWSDNRETNFQAYTVPKITTTVHQLLSNNITEIGNMSNWENNQFLSDQVPIKYNFSINFDAILRGEQSIISNEKYNNWNNDFSDVTNHQGFAITKETSELTSKFGATKPNITIKNSLELSATNGGNIQFKDPWLIDYADPLYGNSLRNCGMDNDGPDKLEFKSRISPFYPDYTTNYNGDVYKGVFLDQSGPPLWNPPYYSVKAESPQAVTINNRTHNFYFQNWTATPTADADFENANNIKTGVVFKNDGVTINANMKGTQLSNQTDAFDNSSQRKFIKTSDGVMHHVYESMGKVWYEKSTNRYL